MKNTLRLIAAYIVGLFGLALAIDSGRHNDLIGLVLGAALIWLAWKKIPYRPAKPAPKEEA